jgi:hypothetical protein
MLHRSARCPTVEWLEDRLAPAGLLGVVSAVGGVLSSVSNTLNAALVSPTSSQTGTNSSGLSAGAALPVVGPVGVSASITSSPTDPGATVAVQPGPSESIFLGSSPATNPGGAAHQPPPPGQTLPAQSLLTPAPAAVAPSIIPTAGLLGPTNAVPLVPPSSGTAAPQVIVVSASTGSLSPGQVTSEVVPAQTAALPVSVNPFAITVEGLTAGLGRTPSSGGAEEPAEKEPETDALPGQPETATAAAAEWQGIELQEAALARVPDDQEAAPARELLFLEDLNESLGTVSQWRLWLLGAVAASATGAALLARRDEARESTADDSVAKAFLPDPQHP